MSEYADSKNVLIADVDCTASGKALCEKHGVSGYPTIKYGDPSNMQKYEGGRDLKSLQSFASENLGPTCGPDHLDLCDEQDKKFITKFQKWDIDELEMSIEEKDAKMKGIEDRGRKAIELYEKQVRELQSKIEKENSKRDKAIEKVKKEAGYKFMKAVKASKEPKVDPDHDPDLEDAAEEKKEEL